MLLAEFILRPADGGDLLLEVPTDVRIRLGEWGAGEDILVERLTTRQRWKVSRELAAVLVLFLGGRDVGEAGEKIIDVLGITADNASLAIALLTERSLLVPAPSPPPEGFPADQVAWSGRGWSAASDYQLATWDYPFVDYDNGGWSQDRVRMASYSEEEPDMSAWSHARCDGISGAVPLPSAREAASHLVYPVGERGPENRLTADMLGILLSAAFGRLPPHEGGRKPRRTSPSGGARHPSEGYLFNLKVDGLETGLLHVRGRGPDLIRLGPLPDRDWFAENMSGIFLAPFAPFEPEAVLVVTSVFARNMYRYREPRTFRTVFLDVGHLIATAEAAAGSLGISAFFHHAVNDREVERELGLTCLTEGVLAAMSLAGRR